MARFSMTREQAMEHLRACAGCGRWITTPTCDHCWVDNHRCPPTVAKAIADLERLVELGKEAQKIRDRLRRTAPAVEV